MQINTQNISSTKLEDFHEASTQNLQDLYISAGDRSYVVGSQNGLFPDFGHHVKDEMGGIWSHPIKLLDGFWLKISENNDLQSSLWLEEANEFTNYPFYNEHTYLLAEQKLKVIRRQFCPDGLPGVVVTYHLTNEDVQDRNFTLSFLGRTDLRPVWFSETLGIEDGEDIGVLDEAEGIFIGNDSKNTWYVVFGADRSFQQGEVDRNLFGPETTSGPGVSGILSYEGIDIKQGQTVSVNFFISGSSESEDAARKTYQLLKNDYSLLFEAKKQRYKGILNRTTINIPDKYLEKVYNWNKFHMDWLTMEVPEIGRGLVAGHPEYCWWFGCDNSYALLGNLPIGNLDLSIKTLDLVHSVSEKENGNGRIIHEVNTFGAVSNKGNTQETPHFIKCVWDTFLWTGDYKFLKNVYPTVKKGINWILNEMDPDGDLLPEGYGIIEIEGLNVELIDSAVYTYEALRVASLMAELFEENSLSEYYRVLSEKLGNTINEQMWIEDEKLYADAMATPEMVLGRIDLYIDRAKEENAEKAVTDLEYMKEKMSHYNPQQQQPWLFKNWVINTPMEIGLAPREKAIPALNRMGTSEFTGPWGTYLSGMYQTHMMTISTGVQAVAECKYDRMDEALRYVNLIASTFNKRLPGSISEMSPDYGCFVQAWTSYGLVWPLISYIFGIQPKAYWKEIKIRPRLPKEWNELSVENVQVGSGTNFNSCNVQISRTDEEVRYSISLQEKGWKLIFDIPFMENQRVIIDGKEVKSYKVINGSLELIIENAGAHEICITLA